MEIYRGSTPTQTFTLPSTASDYSIINLTYSQGDKILVEKNKEDLTISGQTVSLKLKQSDTLKFSEGMVKVQINLVTPGGMRTESDIDFFEVLDTNNGKEL